MIVCVEHAGAKARDYSRLGATFLGFLPHSTHPGTSTKGSISTPVFCGWGSENGGGSCKNDPKYCDTQNSNKKWPEGNIIVLLLEVRQHIRQELEGALHGFYKGHVQLCCAGITLFSFLFFFFWDPTLICELLELKDRVVLLVDVRSMPSTMPSFK